MRLDHSQQEHNLCVFHRGFIIPAVELGDWAENASETRIAKAWVHAALLEYAEWLDTGTQLGYFPKTALRWSLQRIVARLAGLKSIEAFLKDWNYIFHPLMPSRFMYLARNLSLPDSDTYDSPETLVPLFRGSIIRSMQLDKASSSIAFSVWLNFYDPWDRNLALESPVFLEEIARASESVSGFDKTTGEVRLGALYQGFTNWLSYIESVRSAFMHRREREKSSPSDVRKLLQRLTGIQYWRLFRLMPYGADGAHQLQETLTSATIRALSLPNEQRETLFAHVKGLLEFWDRSSKSVSGASL